VVCLERERSTLALRLARQVAAVYLRIDTIERAFVAGEQAVGLGEEGYRVAYAVADDTELSSGSYSGMASTCLARLLYPPIAVEVVAPPRSSAWCQGRRSRRDARAAVPGPN
jgi:hypothetical protein